MAHAVWGLSCHLLPDEAGFHRFVLFGAGSSPRRRGWTLRDPPGPPGLDAISKIPTTTHPRAGSGPLRPGPVPLAANVRMGLALCHALHLPSCALLILVRLIQPSVKRKASYTGRLYSKGGACRTYTAN